MNWTPGPWRVDDVGMIEALDIMTVNGEAIVGYSTIDTERGVDWVQMEANARLFAKAPEMLELLREIGLSSLGALPEALARRLHAVCEEVLG